MSISTNRSMPRESALCTAHAQAKASCLQLPQLRLQGPLACFQDACLLVVGGRAPEAAWLREAAKGREVWAVDHGLDACLAAGIRPQRLIGDGDSAAPAAWQLAKEQHIPIEQFPVEKDDTDTQLALKLAREAGFPAAIVTGAFGGRFDHALSTVTSCTFAALPAGRRARDPSLRARQRNAPLLAHRGAEGHLPAALHAALRERQSHGHALAARRCHTGSAQHARHQQCARAGQHIADPLAHKRPARPLLRLARVNKQPPQAKWRWRTAS